MDTEKGSSRREFADRLEARGFDAEDYAREEDTARAGAPGGEEQIFETSRGFENQVFSTLELREKLGEDALTGAKNLRRYREEAERLQRAAEFNRSPGGTHRKHDILGESPFGIIALDIDHFKHVNDTYGHAAGDEVLREFVRRIQSRIRKGDILARCGGEEFRIIALSVNGSAPLVAEEIRKLIADEPFVIHDNDGKEHSIRVTVSIGVSPYDMATNNMETRSDAALYQAKGNDRDKDFQRNQVWVWDPTVGRPVKYVTKKRQPIGKSGASSEFREASPPN